MDITSSGINTVQAYEWYRSGKLLVNRRYQRKLVWTVEEKQNLIDSILLGYPLPLILLAQTPKAKYEIIDGIQRLNALFSFIETCYPLKDNSYFDLQEFASARLEAEKGSFTPKKNPKLLSRENCSKILNYQLAVTMFSAQDESRINDIFSRINSSGRKLSPQEQRQAGVASEFSDLVRKTASEVRGDDSYNVLELYKMPIISIDTKKESHGYQINAEKTIWCHHGILDTKKLRQSEDEDMIADFLASILLSPDIFPKSKEKLDALYNDTKDAKNIEKKLKTYGSEKLQQEIKTLLSLIDSTVKNHSRVPKTLRKTIMGETSSVPTIKSSFYPLFMAFYELVFKDHKKPANHRKIMQALKGMHKALRIQTRHVTPEQRKKNIDQVKGLIQGYFVKKEPKQLLHGSGLTIDLENSFRRSKIETAHYEFKQGFLRLDAKRTFDKDLVTRLAETACGMANISPERESYIHIGVADRPSHAEKIKEMDRITPKKINGFQVVGIDREAKQKGKTIEQYVDFFIAQFKKTKLSEPLKRSILKHIDIIKYHGFSVIRLKVASQSEVSFVDNQCFIREHSHTQSVHGPALKEIFETFKR